MPKFLTIGYGDRKGYDRTPEAVRNSAHKHDEELVAAGAITGMAGEPVQVRNPDDRGVTTERGAFMRSDLPVAGFSIIEAESLEAAISLVSKVPCAVAHGVVEVWPLTLPDDTPADD